MLDDKGIMICHLRGKITEINFTYIELDIEGVGYHVNIPLLVHDHFHKVGEEITLFIQAVYREDAHTLYGFLTKDERDFFNLIISHVSGVGPKTALNIMSRMSLDILKQAILNRDIDILSKCQGLGKKTAEKLVVELSDKVAKMMKHNTLSFGKNELVMGGDAVSSNITDAVSALISLGYRANDADKAIKKALEHIGVDASTEELLKFSLKA